MTLNSSWKSSMFAPWCLLVASAAMAQGTASPGPGAGMGMGPGMGMGMGPGMGMGMGPGNVRMGPGYTSGWALMSEQERTEHRNRMLGMKSYDECKSYAEQHHAQMTERAREKGRPTPVMPRRDACAWLKG
jgi:hypothetical protein